MDRPTSAIVVIVALMVTPRVFQSGEKYVRVRLISKDVSLYGACRTVLESLPDCNWDFGRLRLRVILYTAGGGLLLLWTGFKTVVLAGIVAPFAGVLGCGLWCLAMIWVEWKQLPPVYRMSRWLIALTAFAGITMTVVGCYVTALTWWR